ncbi:pyridoxal kinase [Clostridia bacterium]|nr:pyridoxal kinase [Clostridia bacterium]
MTAPPIVLAIHDLSGYGRCSLSVALPALSAQGVQCVALPTAYLSAHTGFKSFTFTDMTAQLSPAAQHYRELGLRFGAVYSGFLGSEAQIDVVSRIFAAFKTDDTLIVVDPVMGDDGRTYKTYTPSMCRRMRELTRRADLITPNITEAAILLDEDYSAAPKRYEDFQPWLEKLSNGGRTSVLITGVRPAQCRVGQVYYDRNTGNFGCCQRPFAGRSFNGTGDLYASVVVGAMTLGAPLAAAADKAAGFVFDCCKLSYDNDTDPSEGVRFEPLLWKLGNRE